MLPPRPSCPTATTPPHTYTHSTARSPFKETEEAREAALISGEKATGETEEEIEARRKVIYTGVVGGSYKV